MTRSAMLFVAAITLAACGDGGGDSPNLSGAAGLDGIYQGTVASQTGTRQAVGLIAPTGETRVFISNGFQYAATLVPVGSTFSAQFRAFDANGAPFGEGSTSGSFVARESLSGTFTLGSDSGSYAFTFDAANYNAGSSPSRIAGSWSSQDIAVTVESNGAFFGQDDRGCTLSGSVVPFNPQFNLYDISGSITCPGSQARAIEGLAVIVVDNGADALIVTGSSDLGSITDLLRR